MSPGPSALTDTGRAYTLRADALTGPNAEMVRGVFYYIDAAVVCVANCRCVCSGSPLFCRFSLPFYISSHLAPPLPPSPQATHPPSPIYARIMLSSHTREQLHSTKHTMLRRKPLAKFSLA